MWIFMRDAMLSIVEHPSESKIMNVYSRIRGDIECVFPEADVLEAVEGDYRFRTSLQRDRVMQAIALRIGKINYPVFGDAIEDADRRAAYIQVWSDMYDEQQRRYGPPDLSEEPVRPTPRYVLEDERYTFEEETAPAEIVESVPPATI